ncbi:glycosyltransferase family 2 protein [Flavobacteriaceae bacterium]|nr:glycosyltransferase family 2 protein [Flavobacteriaceae bacterium]
MISVCIPVYNFNIEPLVRELKVQVDDLNCDIEIIVIDDASELEFRKQNKLACSDVGYLQLPENIGRAKIRNLFLEYASMDYLLFLDGDSLIHKPKFLKDYITLLDKADVIYGGREYPVDLPSSEQYLSWYYGSWVESKPVVKRIEEGYLAFMSNNFLINAAVFEDYNFNEAINGYGHEDTYFSYQLSENNISLLHVDNPVLNGDLETNAVFVLKLEKAIENLVLLYENDSDKFTGFVNLLAYYKQCNKVKRVVIKYSFLVLKPLLRSFLLKGTASLKMISFYKLGCFLNKV